MNNDFDAERLTLLLSELRLPDILALLQRFAPDPARLPPVSVQLAPLSSYAVLTQADLEVAA